MKNKIGNILLIFSLIILSLALLFRKPAQIYKTAKTKVIKERVEAKKRLVDSVVVHEKTIRTQLNEYKSIYDTVQIVKYQDSLITILDTHIVILNSILKDQDTIITQLEFDNKRLRRQRNLSIVLNGILGTALILK